MTERIESLYDMLVEVDVALRDSSTTKGLVILNARQKLDTILGMVQSDVSTGEVYRPGHSIILDEDEEETD